MKIALVVCLVALASARPALAQTLDATAADSLVREVVRAFDAPGVAVAIVKDGQRVIARGYGVRKAGDPAPVNDRTLFYTASVTKAFTVTALGIAADEGRLRIDDPVVKYLPAFAVGDDVLTGALTIRDLMAHRTGLPRADMLMVSGLSNPEILGRLHALAPQAPIRSRFSYQNQMYLALGLLLERLGGSTWSRIIEEKVLRPVGFVDGNAGGLGHWPAGAAVAAPHARGLDGTVAVDLIPREPYGAGGVNASARDLAAWLQFQLGDGAVNGAKIVNANVLAAQHAPNTLVPGNLTMASAVLTTYGLGWFVHDYHGEKIVQHGGNGEGWTSLVWMVPQHKLGIAVLTNMHNSALPHALAYTITDRVLGRAPKNWVDEFKSLEPRLGPPPLPAPPPGIRTLTASAVGEYRHPVYGSASIVGDGDRLVFTYGTLAGAIEGTALTWRRSDMAAVLGVGRISARDDGLLIEAGGQRFEFTRVR